MLVSTRNNSDIIFNQTYEAYDKFNILLNDIEDFTSTPEDLGNALAHIWLVLAEKHEKNKLSSKERKTVFENIYAAIEKIKNLEDSKIIHQSFISKMASFNDQEQHNLINFFKETIDSDFKELCYSTEKEYYFFLAFVELFNPLISLIKSLTMLIKEGLNKL